MDVSRENDSKAEFSDVYSAPTPHAYLDEMCRHGYQIGEQARPYGEDAVQLLAEANPDAWAVQALDIGCSYGIGSAFLKYGCSFEELVAFFHSRAPRDPAACAAATRAWLNVVPPKDLRVVGLDASRPAIEFGLASGLLDGGLARDLEQPGAALDEDERAWVRSSNLIVSTGAIGYVTERTLGHVLPELGLDHPGSFGPLAVITILRMFDERPIRAAFEDAGWTFERVEGVRLPQRAFVDAEEQAGVLALLQERGLNTADWENQGVLYADLYAGAKGPEHAALNQRLRVTASRLTGEESLFASHSQVADIAAGAPVIEPRRSTSR